MDDHLRKGYAECKKRLSTICARAALALMLLHVPPLRAADTDDIAEGMQLFLNKGGCPSCRGWAGDGHCYGMKPADLKNNPLPDPPNTLQQREIERIVDFLLAKVIKQSAMDRAKRAAYWGKDAEVCSEVK